MRKIFWEDVFQQVEAAPLGKIARGFAFAVLPSLALYYLMYLAFGWWGVGAIPFIALALACA